MKKKQKVNSKNFLVLLIVALGGVGILGFSVFNNEESSSIIHSNPIDAQISVYSDKHITSNAIGTNPKFKTVAFATPPTGKNLPFGNQLAAVVRTVKSFAVKPLQKDEPKEYGTWIWTPILQMTPDYIESIVSQAEKERVNVIYLSLDSYLDIFVMADGAEKEKLEKIFSEKAEDFIIRANIRGIEVDAEGGWRNWAEEGNQYKAFAIVDYVKKFNQTHLNKFRGFQYDVEPYLLEKYQEDPVPVLKNFVELVDKTQYFLADSDLRFSVVVPDFYDKKDGFTPGFVYDGRRDYVFGHLLNILERKPNGSIIVMSYRNFAEGQDGSIQISKNEIETARRGSYNTKIIIAQETGNFPPPYITFHNISKNHLLAELSKLKSAFSPSSSFGGFAIHYANTFLELK